LDRPVVSCTLGSTDGVDGIRFKTAIKNSVGPIAGKVSAEAKGTLIVPLTSVGFAVDALCASWWPADRVFTVAGAEVRRQLIRGQDLSSSGCPVDWSGAKRWIVERMDL